MCTGACGDEPTEEQQNEERGDICMALEDYGVEEDVLDEVRAMTVEDARLYFLACTHTEWHWEAVKDSWVLQAMSSYTAPDNVFDPHGNLKHRYYEEN